MSVSVTQILMQYGYLTNEQYNFAYQLQQSQPVELRQPLLQIYLEQGFLGTEHLEYCLALRQQYISQGVDMEQPMAQPTAHEHDSAQQAVGGVVKCKVCLSECQAGWAMCPFCGNSLN